MAEKKISKQLFGSPDETSPISIYPGKNASGKASGLTQTIALFSEETPNTDWNKTQQISISPNSSEQKTPGNFTQAISTFSSVSAGAGQTQDISIYPKSAPGDNNAQQFSAGGPAISNGPIISGPPGSIPSGGGQIPQQNGVPAPNGQMSQNGPMPPGMQKPPEMQTGMLRRDIE